MEIGDTNRYELKASQLSSELKRDEIKSRELREAINARTRAYEHRKESFEVLKKQLLERSLECNQKAALHKARHLSKSLHKNSKVMNALAHDISSLQCEQIEVGNRMQLLGRKIDVCEEQIAMIRDEVHRGRELTREEDINQLSSIREERVEERNAELRRHEELGGALVEDSGQSIFSIVADSGSQVGGSGTDALVIDSNQSGNGGQQRSGAGDGSSGGPADGADQERAQRVGDCTSEAARSVNRALSLQQLVGRVERMMAESRSGESNLELDYLAKSGRRIGLKISGGANTPLRVEIMPDSAVDRRILWSESRSILNALREGGIAVKEVRVSGSSAGLR